MLLAQPNKDGGIVHALQPKIVPPEIIARIGMRWWNASCTAVAGTLGSVVCKAVIKHNLGDFGGIFDELHDALPKSLPRPLQ